MKKIFLIMIAMSLITTGCAQKPVNIENYDKPAAKEEGPGDIIDLSGQRLEKIPEYVFSESNLHELDVSRNRLTGAIQAEIGHLKNLRVLRASDNQMTGVPAEIGRLDKLEVLDLSNNRLTGLPHELGNLKNLKILDISGNDYSEADLNIIEQGLTGVDIVK
ncbi:MAG: leucine-rich repeat domain-containing protein [Candidatus Falkowbacteria bacterium]